jgi:tetratricopeptide (TPR) repeat protein
MTMLGILLASLIGGGDETGPQVIRLKVGTEVVATIEPEGFDEAKGVRVRRVDDGALLDIGFDQMVPEDVQRIRGLYGYMPDDPDPLIVDAMKIKLMDGSEMTALVVDQGVDVITVRRGLNTIPLKRSNVRSIDPVKVDALEVYDAEELYARELGSRNPTTALDHYNFALWCESLQLWNHAKDELAKVSELDANFKADVVGTKLKQYQRRIDASDDAALIARAQKMVRRDDYDHALALLDDFLKQKPSSALRSDAERTRARVAKARDKWLNEQVIVYFFTYLERSVKKIAADPKISAKEARKAVETTSSKEAIEATAKWLKVAPEEVQKVWEDDKRNTASPHFGNYGSGTWTLGLEGAMKGFQVEDPNKKKSEDETGGKEKSLEDRIKDALEKKRKEQEEAKARGKNKGGQRSTKKQPPAGPQVADIDPKEEDWWASLRQAEKTQYLTAWWAEHDPHAKVYHYEQAACVLCTALGKLKFYNASGQEGWNWCPRCKGLGFDRIVRFH